MKKRHIYWTVALIVIAIIIVLLSIGYRIDGWKIIKAGNITVTVPHSGSVVYLNNKEYKTTKADNQIVKFRSLPEKEHSIIVAKEGNWPWAKKAVARPNETRSFVVWNLEQTSTMEIIQKGTPEYAENSALISSYKLPTIEAPMYSTDQKMSLYVNNSTVYITWYGDVDSVPELFCEKNRACKRTVPLISLVKKVSGIFFYPNTNDRLIISSEGSVSALEIAETGNQNYQYITLGSNPSSYVIGDTLYIKDGEAMGKVTLK